MLSRPNWSVAEENKINTLNLQVSCRSARQIHNTFCFHVIKAYFKEENEAVT